jgi:ribosomal protein S18 acetylase RimI-like enzyme
MCRDRPLASSTWSTDRGKFQVRRANLQDLQPLTHILINCFHITHPNQEWLRPFVQFTFREELRQRLRSTSPYYACWVALQFPPLTSQGWEGVLESEAKNAMLIGTVEMDLRYANFRRSKTPQIPQTGSKNAIGAEGSYLYVSNLAVAQEFRRQGAAKHLLGLCEQTARNWGFEELYLHVLEDNQEAQQLYFKGGYQLQCIDPGWGILWFEQPRRLLLRKLLR